MVQIYNSYYPTSIYQTTLDITDKYRQECIDEIYRLGDSMNYSTNVKALMTSYRIYENSSVFNYLINNIFKSITICPWIISSAHTKFSSVWGAVYKENEEAMIHNHGNALMSFVLYLQIDQTSSPLKIHTNPEIIIYPKVNDLIMFRGYVNHSVPPLPKVINKDRVVIAGNLVEALNLK